jgi:hypothetical protein
MARLDWRAEIPEGLKRLCTSAPECLEPQGQRQGHYSRGSPGPLPSLGRASNAQAAPRKTHLGDGPSPKRAVKTPLHEGYRSLNERCLPLGLALAAAERIHASNGLISCNLDAAHGRDTPRGRHL